MSCEPINSHACSLSYIMVTSMENRVLIQILLAHRKPLMRYNRDLDELGAVHFVRSISVYRIDTPLTLCIPVYNKIALIDL